MSQVPEKWADINPFDTSIYQAWSDMKGRCYNKKHKQYKDYGGRGIKVSFLWYGDFGQFMRDIGPKPTPKHTLDRIDNNGDYEPKNCRWATRQQQARNRRR